MGRWTDPCAAGRRVAWRAVLLGLAPLAVWLAFALIYYGFAYPNTAYARLNVAIPRGQLLAQGLGYLLDSLLSDLLVLPIILCGKSCRTLSQRRRYETFHWNVLYRFHCHP